MRLAVREKNGEERAQWREVAALAAAGFAAACMFYVFRHFVQEALYESSNAGWKDSLHGGTMEHHHH